MISPTIEGLRISGGDASNLGGGSSDSDAGGGVYVFGASAAISSSVVFSNTAHDGAGLYFLNSAGMLSRNLIRDNAAGWNGGGLSIYQGSPHLSENTIVSNSTADVGGGVQASYTSAHLQGNVVSGNTAQRGGGLWWTGGGATLDGNIIASNTASESGGGLYLWLGTNTVMNNVITDNHAQNKDGNGVYFEGSNSQLIHNTIVRNTGGHGTGVHITDSWGNPSRVGMTNTLVISHVTDISVTASSTAIANGILWFGNGSNIGGSGSVTVSNAYAGTPAFGGDGYHLALGSVAIDKGVNAGVTTDVDNQPRPYGAEPDLGADEYVPAQILRSPDFSENGLMQGRTPALLLLFEFAYSMVQ